MNTIPLRRGDARAQAVPLLDNGDRMTQPEFHRRYQACAEDVKFELIGGTVYMASPLRWPHGTYDSKLNLALSLYEAATPGVEVGTNATTILGEESEPQPDLALRILSEFGGRSTVNEEKYLEGPPELIAEVAYSTRAIDLHFKKNDYQKAGVAEYLVLCVEEQELHWFVFTSGGQLRPDRQGIYRSRVFPGLWIAGPALLARDSSGLARTVQRGLASRAHAAFVKRLQAARRRLPRTGEAE
jgi:Uma2 family endonuclease